MERREGTKVQLRGGKEVSKAVWYKGEMLKGSLPLPLTKNARFLGNSKGAMDEGKSPFVFSIPFKVQSRTCGFKS